jgi:hypothetical protein
MAWNVDAQTLEVLLRHEVVENIDFHQEGL